MLIESYTKFIYSFIEKILSESDILLSSKFIDGRDNSRGDEWVRSYAVPRKVTHSGSDESISYKSIFHLV
jgi:hypothetical protein